MSHCEALVAAGKGGIEINGLSKVLLCERVIVPSDFKDMPQPALIGGPGVESSRRLPHRALLLGGDNGRGNCHRHCLGDLVLHCKDVGEISVAALGPDVLTSFGL